MPAGISAPAPPARPSAAKVVGLVGGAHFFSHFYMFLLPPIFPLLKDVYGVDFVALGFALTVFNLASAAAQAPAGFLVDRFGARRLLIGGLVLQSCAIASIGVFPGYPALLVLMALSGLANTVYHPCDYTIMNASIDKPYMGRAFSVHTFSGYVGQAIGPITMIFLITLMPWTHALAIAGACGLGVAVLITLNSRVLKETAARHERGSSPVGEGLRILASLPVIMGALFFAGISMSGQGITTFGYSALDLLYEAPLETIGLIVSAYLFANPAGVLIGGWVADKTRYHERNVACFFLVAALCVLTIAVVALPVPTLALLLGIAGLFSGMVAPSRDMLIRSVTPSRHIGKVFGFVSLGFNLGGVLAPLLFGYLLDPGEPRLVFAGAGALLLLTIMTVLSTARAGRAARAGG